MKEAALRLIITIKMEKNVIFSLDENNNFFKNMYKMEKSVSRDLLT